MQKPADDADNTIGVSTLMDTPAGRDEYGTPDDQIVECDECERLHRRGGAHRCTDGEWVGR